MKNSLAAAAVIALLTSGCSGGSDAGQEVPDTASGLAKAIGSKGCQVDEDVMLVKEQVTCAGGKVIVMTFADHSGAQAYVDATEGMGGDPQLVGDTWVIEAGRPVLEKAKGEVGGKIAG